MAQPSSKPCFWNGEWYPSVSAAARANHISRAGMASRLAKGYTCDDDLNPGVAFTWNGITYKSVTEAARATGVSFHTMYQRLLRGRSSDDEMRWSKSA